MADLGATPDTSTAASAASAAKGSPMPLQPSPEFPAHALLHAEQHERVYVNDWDLLSSSFQREAAAYLQVLALLIVVLLVNKRARASLTRSSPAASAQLASTSTSPMARPLGGHRRAPDGT